MSCKPFIMENERTSSDENLFERDTRDDFSSGPLAAGDREDMNAGDEYDNDEIRRDEDTETDEELDGE